MIRKSFLKLFLILLLAVLYVASTNTSKAQTYEGKVIKVTDGDSINILYEGKPLRIRLAEIDAPERNQPFGRKSREALADIVAGAIVLIEQVDIDRWDRVVGQVYLGNLWVNGAMVRGGFAYVYPKYATTDRLYDYEAEAQKSNAGIWKLPESERIKPWEWRKRKK
jgi:endonuclease YncB( thermonuclease family)